MHVFKPSYRDRSGKARKAAKWYIEFKAPDGLRRRLPAFADKGASEELGRKIQTAVSYKIAGKDPASLSTWIDSLPSSIADLLTKWGVVERHRTASGKSLTGHLADYVAALEAAGSDPVYVTCTRRQIETVLDGTGATFWPELDAHKIALFVAKLPGRKGKLLKRRSVNGYYTALKSWCNWAVGQGRIPYNPLNALKLLKLTDEEKRRALSVEEFRRLLLTLANKDAPVDHGMTAAERALLYTVAVETGLRADELAKLTRASFELDGDAPVVKAREAETKNRRGATIDLSADLAAKLRPWLETKMPGARAFDMPSSQHTAEMIRGDLARARAAWLAEAGEKGKERERREKSDVLVEKDAAGRVVTFHSLRHCRGTWLFQHHGANPREVQELMRVSTLRLVERYSEGMRIAGQAIANRGPDLSTPDAPSGAQQADGTTGDAGT